MVTERLRSISERMKFLAAPKMKVCAWQRVRSAELRGPKMSSPAQLVNRRDLLVMIAVIRDIEKVRGKADATV